MLLALATAPAELFNPDDLPRWMPLIGSWRRAATTEREVVLQRVTGHEEEDRRLALQLQQELAGVGSDSDDGSDGSEDDGVLVVGGGYGGSRGAGRGGRGGGRRGGGRRGHRQPAYFVDVEDDEGAGGASPQDAEEWTCLVCNREDNDDVLMACSGCDKKYHTFCLAPPLDAVPDGHWICDECDSLWKSSGQYRHLTSMHLFVHARRQALSRIRTAAAAERAAQAVRAERGGAAAGSSSSSSTRAAAAAARGASSTWGDEPDDGTGSRGSRHQRQPAPRLLPAPPAAPRTRAPAMLQEASQIGSFSGSSADHDTGVAGGGGGGGICGSGSDGAVDIISSFPATMSSQAAGTGRSYPLPVAASGAGAAATSSKRVGHVVRFVTEASEYAQLDALLGESHRNMEPDDDQRAGDDGDDEEAWRRSQHDPLKAAWFENTNMVSRSRDGTVTVNDSVAGAYYACGGGGLSLESAGDPRAKLPETARKRADSLREQRIQHKAARYRAENYDCSFAFDHGACAIGDTTCRAVHMQPQLSPSLPFHCDVACRHRRERSSVARPHRH